jgi:DNA-binding response OmpR family regulator
VVDDSDIQREVIADALTAEGYEVSVAADGQEGLAAARDSHPDVLILDLMMPGMDGAALLAEIRSDASFAGMRVVVTTGIHTPHVARLLRPDAILFKPFGPGELVGAVAGLVQRGTRPRSP